MNCRRFHKNVADFVAGRLNAQQASAMRNHASVCSDCKRLESDEQSLRGVFQGAGDISPVADLWPRLATQLSATPVRSSFWSARTRFVAVCGAAFCFLIGIGAGTFVAHNNFFDSNTRELLTNTRAADQHLVTLVNDMRETSVAETDAIWAEDLPGHQMQREVPMGANE